MTTTKRNVKKLRDLYLRPSLVSSLGGVSRLMSKARGETGLKRSAVQSWLSTQDAYTLHKPVRTKFQRRPTIVNGMSQQLQADLLDISSHKNANDGFTFLLTTVDVFSRKAWVEPIKSKSGMNVREALTRILDKQTFRYLQTDKGKEFYNSNVSGLLVERNMSHFSSENETIKSSLVERFNQTLRGKIHRHLTATLQSRFIDDLQDMVNSYNETIHSSTGFAPNNVTLENEEEVWSRLYDDDVELLKTRHPKFSVGDYVRMSKYKKTFARGYTPNWTREVFTISSVQTQERPVVYILQDLAEELIKGTFYESELQKVTKPTKFTIEKVIRKRRRGNIREILVKWLDYPEKFNIWIPESNLM